jgi:phage terminase large subunit-like protein
MDLSQLSKAEQFSLLDKKEQKKRLSKLTDIEAEILLYDWDWWARPKQKFPKENYFTWLILAGRGFGKTRIGAEWIKWKAKSNNYCNLMGATMSDAEEIMIYGESGILNICNRWERPIYKKADKKLIWPNGNVSLIFSAEEPDRLRGKQHSNLWLDEIAAWRYEDAYDQAIFGLRLGNNTQSIITTTTRPTDLIKKLKDDKSTIVTIGTSFENKSNLSPTFIKKLKSTYENTRLGRQEIYAEILDKNENALFLQDIIDETRINKEDISENFSRIIIGIDPAVTSNENSDFTGIVVAGKHENGEYYILEDATILAKPSEWCIEAIKLYYKYKADLIVAETNNGGDMVEELLKNFDDSVNYKKVTATRGKILRAEPIAGLYEQKKVHHVGVFKDLEMQMTKYTGLEKKSPDRLDALVWALHELSDNDQMGIFDYYKGLYNNRKNK